MQETTPSGLPRIVGYSEVVSALGVQRRTIERMVREKKFPAPIQLSSNRVGWRVNVVIDWLKEREARVLAFSKEDLSGKDPQQLAEGTARLGAALLTGISGQLVKPEDIRLGRVATPAESDVIWKASWEHRHQIINTMFVDLDFPEALIVVHALFPPLRTMTGEIAKRGGLSLPKDRNTLIDWALSILLTPPEIKKKKRAERGLSAG
jgi:predicted DNA-binding transcriptional regulator AlpA